MTTIFPGNFQIMCEFSMSWILIRRRFKKQRRRRRWNQRWGQLGWSSDRQMADCEGSYAEADTILGWWNDGRSADSCRKFQVEWLGIALHGFNHLLLQWGGVLRLFNKTDSKYHSWIIFSSVSFQFSATSVSRPRQRQRTWDIGRWDQGRYGADKLQCWWVYWKSYDKVSMCVKVNLALQSTCEHIEYHWPLGGFRLPWVA